ncbi:MAG TPA: hypothetical protein EYG71_05270 [Leucothrix sp.]|nr:hypothetical protein [Leucothrix sp.]
MKIVINPSFHHLKYFIENIERHFEESTNTLYDQRNKIKVVSFEGQDYVVKSFRIPNAVNRFVYRYLRPSKAKRSYEYSLKIGEQFSPEAVAYIEEYDNLLLTKSYYISKRYDYDFTIRPVLLDETFDQKKRKQVLIELAKFTFELHQNNILHNDFSYGNILIKEQGNRSLSNQFQFRIIDVNRMQFKSLTCDERLNNFSRLGADDDAMEIIMQAYAALIQEPFEEVLLKAKYFRDEFKRKRVLKNKLRGRR